MMFGVTDFSTTAGCAAGVDATAIKKLPKARYGRYFSGSDSGSDFLCDNDVDEGSAGRFKCRPEKSSRSNKNLKNGLNHGMKLPYRFPCAPKRQNVSKRLFKKLLRILTMRDISKTFPSMKKQNRQNKKRRSSCNSSSLSSTISGNFEPMPTIIEETESELDMTIHQFSLLLNDHRLSEETILSTCPNPPEIYLPSSSTTIHVTA